MSAVAVLTPIVVASWPAISSAVAAAAVSLGFNVLQDVAQEGLPRNAGAETSRKVTFDVPHSEVVTGTLGRDQRVRLGRDGVVAEFSRDSRGRAAVCVTGAGYSEEQLRAIGEELSGRMVQQYMLTKLKNEMAARGMDLVEETVDETQSIRLRVRHWQN